MENIELGYVSLLNDEVVAQFDTDDGSELNTIATTTTETVLDGGGNLYAAEFNDDTVRKYDTDRNIVWEETDILENVDSDEDDGFDAIAYHPPSDELFIIAEVYPESIWILDASDGSVKKFIDVDDIDTSLPNDITVSDGRLISVGSGTSYAVIDAETEDEVTSYSVGLNEQVSAVEAYREEDKVFAGVFEDGDSKVYKFSDKDTISQDWIEWRDKEANIQEITLDDTGNVYAFSALDEFGITRHDYDTGSIDWERDDIQSITGAVVGNSLYVGDYGDDSLYELEADTGNTTWNASLSNTPWDVVVAELEAESAEVTITESIASTLSDGETSSLTNAITSGFSNTLSLSSTETTGNSFISGGLSTTTTDSDAQITGVTTTETALGETIVVAESQLNALTIPSSALGNTIVDGPSIGQVISSSAFAGTITDGASIGNTSAIQEAIATTLQPTGETSVETVVIQPTALGTGVVVTPNTLTGATATQTVVVAESTIADVDVVIFGTVIPTKGGGTRLTSTGTTQTTPVVLSTDSVVYKTFGTALTESDSGAFQSVSAKTETDSTSQSRDVAVADGAATSEASGETSSAVVAQAQHATGTSNTDPDARREALAQLTGVLGETTARKYVSRFGGETGINEAREYLDNTED